ncbi:MAG: response regulator transcription factor [Gammaproteobacteria bacterium]|nr:response regulator transcription factor [Gammaproteobacteria bacterium]
MNQTVSRGPLLIVEDDKKTSELLSIYFEREGFKTITAYSGQRALDLASQHDPVLVILDVLLPDLDGWDVCQKIRASSAVPILMLSGLGEAHERIKGLALGADDYLAKPFSPREVVTRVKAILRRSKIEPPPNGTLSCGSLVLNRDRRKLTLNGSSVPLARSEFRLLEVLMSAPGRIFLRDELLDLLAPNGGTVVDRVIDVHIGNLRQKIEDDPSKPRQILTARGLGYQFADVDRRPGS